MAFAAPETDEEVFSAPEDEVIGPSAGGVALRSFARSGVPALGGGRLGAMLGAGAAGLLTGAAEGSAVPVWGNIVGGLIGAGAGMYAAGKGQEAIANYIDPTTANPFSTASEQADVAAHPLAAELGGMAWFKPNPVKLARSLEATVTTSGRQLLKQGFGAQKQLFELTQSPLAKEAITDAAKAAEFRQAIQGIETQNAAALKAFRDVSGVGGNVGIGAGMGTLQGENLPNILKGAGMGALFNDEWLGHAPHETVAKTSAAVVPELKETIGDDAALAMQKANEEFQKQTGVKIETPEVPETPITPEQQNIEDLIPKSEDQRHLEDAANIAREQANEHAARAAVRSAIPSIEPEPITPTGEPTDATSQIQEQIRLREEPQGGVESGQAQSPIAGHRILSPEESQGQEVEPPPARPENSKEWLKDLREKSGLTQEQAAAKLAEIGDAQRKWADSLPEGTVLKIGDSHYVKLDTGEWRKLRNDTIQGEAGPHTGPEQANAHEPILGGIQWRGNERPEIVGKYQNGYDIQPKKFLPESGQAPQIAPAPEEPLIRPANEPEGEKIPAKPEPAAEQAKAPEANRPEVTQGTRIETEAKPPIKTTPEREAQLAERKADSGDVIGWLQHVAKGKNVDGKDPSISSSVAKLILDNVPEERLRQIGLFVHRRYSSGGNFFDNRVTLNHKDTDNTFIHEVIHALSNDLIENNSDLRKKIEALRKRALETVPESKRQKIEANRGESDISEFEFGMSNPHEFVSQLYSSKEFRDGLARIKGKNGSLLDEALHETKEIFGKTSNAEAANRRVALPAGEGSERGAVGERPLPEAKASEQGRGRETVPAKEVAPEAKPEAPKGVATHVQDEIAKERANIKDKEKLAKFEKSLTPESIKSMEDLANGKEGAASKLTERQRQIAARAKKAFRTIGETPAPEVAKPEEPAPKPFSNPVPEKKLSPAEELQANRRTEASEQRKTLSDGREPIKFGAPQEEKAAKQAAIDRLNTTGKKLFTLAEPKLSPKQQRFINAFQKIFNRRVVFFRTPEGAEGGVNGFVEANDPSHLFINADSSHSPLAIAGHEFAESLAFTHPDLHKELIDAVRPLLENDVGYLERLNEARKKLGLPEVDLSAVHDDMVADYVGRRLFDEDFLKKLAAENPTGFQKFAEVLRKWIAKIKAAFVGTEHEDLVKDMDKADTAIAKLLRSLVKEPEKIVTKLRGPEPMEMQEPNEKFAKHPVIGDQYRAAFESAIKTERPFRADAAESYGVKIPENYTVGDDGIARPENRRYSLLNPERQAELKEDADRAKTKLRDFAKGTYEAAKDLLKQAKDIATFTGGQRALGEFSATAQGDVIRTERRIEEAKKAVPSRSRQEAITVWREANGDDATLKKWSEDTKNKNAHFSRIAEAARHLTPEEVRQAGILSGYLNEQGQRAADAGLLDQRSLENNSQDYTQHVWEKPLTRAQQDALGQFNAKLARQFKPREHRTFGNFYEGIMAGFKPKTLNAFDLYGNYAMHLSKVEASNRLMKDLLTAKGKDGNPLAIVQGADVTQDREQGPRFIDSTISKKFDDAAGEKVPYRTVNDPRLWGWKYASTDAEGNPIMLKGNLAFHPEIAKHIENMLGGSAIHQWINRPSDTVTSELLKRSVKLVDSLNGAVKQGMFGFSPFHIVQEATHALGHKVNPTKIVKIDPNNPDHIDAMQHGLMLANDNLRAGHFMEGLSSGEWMEKIPVAGQIAKGISNFTFNDYIPSLKIQTYENALARNLKRFDPEIKNGSVTADDVKFMTAKQVNDAYGHLNYKAMGRNPTIQHMLRLFLLAPDFLEARTRFALDAIKGGLGAKVGREQTAAMAILAGTFYTGARILNALLNNGDTKTDHPFSVVAGNREYSMRSVPEDIYKMISDPRKFAMGRISPLISRTGVELGTGRNYRGENIPASEALKNAALAGVPISLRDIPGLRDLTQTNKNNPVSPLEAAMSSLGIHVNAFSPTRPAYDLARKYKESIGKPDTGVYPISKYNPIKYALEDNDLERAKTELDKLKAAQKDMKKLAQEVHASLFHSWQDTAADEAAFLKSLTPEQKGIMKAAEQRRTDIWRRFKRLTGQGANLSETTTVPKIKAA